MYLLPDDPVNFLKFSCLPVSAKNSEVSPEIKQQLSAIGESQGMISDNIVFFSNEGKSHAHGHLCQ